MARARTCVPFVGKREMRLRHEIGKLMRANDRDGAQGVAEEIGFNLAKKEEAHFLRGGRSRRYDPKVKRAAMGDNSFRHNTRSRD